VLDDIRREKMRSGPGIYHGAAEVREDYDDVLKGTVGIVTAYLPEDNTFAIFWPDNNLVTYHMSEEDFESIFRLSSMDEIKIVY
jgi:hypothetical protein